MTTLATVIALAWLLTLTGLVLWAANAYRAVQQYARDTNERVDALEHRQDIVDRRWRDAEMAALAQIGNPASARKGPEKPRERPQERRTPPGPPTDTPHAQDELRQNETPEPDPATIDADVRPGRPPVPPPPAAPTEAIHAVTPEPDPAPPTEPALQPRRGVSGRWVEGPGGSLVYRREDTDR
jgi:hypothetical protein